MTDDVLTEARARARRRAGWKREALLTKLMQIDIRLERFTAHVLNSPAALAVGDAPEQVGKLIITALAAHEAAVAWREALAAEADTRQGAE